MRTGARSVFLRAFVAVAGLLAPTFTGAIAISGQQQFTHGQNVAPAFEGWERNPDGSFNMAFGFFNRNCEESLHIPIGPDNNIEPGGPDRGQPTRFFPRRGKFIFKVRVPSDFGKNELVWTVTAHGKTEKAYATLRPEYVLDKRIIMMNENSFGQRFGEGDNQYPILDVAGEAHRAVKVGEPLPLSAQASDDGLPLPRTDRRDASKEPPLVAGWVLYRGDDAHVSIRSRTGRPGFQEARNVPERSARASATARREVHRDGDLQRAGDLRPASVGA